MKTYHGYRRMMLSHDGTPTTCTCIVQVCGHGRKRPLRPRLDIRNHSPTGFEWGFGGSGPAQLALALVADCCGAKLAVPGIYQRVKRIVANLPHEGWTLTEEEIRQAVEAAKNEAGAHLPEDAR